jgi:hypothetical protein
MEVATRWFAFILWIYFVWWWAFRKPAAMDFFRAFCYWIGKPTSTSDRGPEDRVLRYLSDVYGSGIDIAWVNRCLLGFGLTGCVLAWGMLLNGLCRLYLSVHIPSAWNSWLEPVLLSELFLPVLVMSLGKWRKPMASRRIAAVGRIFGNLERAMTVASVLRNRFPGASDVPTTWAFPQHPDYAVYEEGKPFLIAYGFFIGATLFVAHSPSRFLITVTFLLALYFVPVVFHGLFATFGAWEHKRKDLMTYPVSVLLRDMRILESERRLGIA